MQSDKPALPPRPVSVRSSTTAQSPATPGTYKPPLPARPIRITTVASSTSSGAPSPTTTMSIATRTQSTERGIVYPETFNAGRYPPLASGCKNDLTAKAPVTCIASSRGYIVTGSIGGYRIWNMLSGECQHTGSKPGGAEVKASAVCFLPSHNHELDGRFFWIGFSDGDLWMVDVFTGSVLERRVSVHNHRVLHILRLLNLMLTIDENGIMQIWSDLHSDTATIPLFNYSTRMERGMHLGQVVTLEGKPRSIRIGGNQDVACVVNRQLWTANERSIEVLSPLEQSPFRQKIEVPNNFGVISSAAAVYRGIPLPGSVADLLIQTVDCVYTGHVDGKILEWDAQTFVKRRVFDTGSYRIVSMLALSVKLLWVNVGTGKSMVFDVGDSTELTVVKEWSAEVKDSLDLISVDVDSMMHQGQIIVCGCYQKSGHVQIFDALFPVDYVQSEMQKREAEYCEYSEMKLLILSFNIDAQKPEALHARAEDAYFLDKWVTTVPEGADIFVVGLQELVDLESKSVAAKGLWKKKSQPENLNNADHESRARLWRERLSKALKDNYKHAYHLLDTRNMVGLFTCVFVKDSLRQRVSHVESIQISTGMGGTYGNKGAIVTRFCIDHSSFCFLTCHLPAHQNKVGRRNVDAWTILRSDGLSPVGLSEDDQQLFLVRGGDGSQILDYESIFFFGDLNYRLDLERDYCLELINKQAISQLLEEDQLIKQRQLANSTCLLRLFQESPINFLPTYKYDPGTDTYDSSEKKRVPAYCDRILYRDSVAQTSTCLIDQNQRHLPSNPRIVPLCYKRFECKISDHRPIAAAYQVTVKHLVDPHQRMAKRVVIESDFGKRKQEYLWDAGVRWILQRCVAERAMVETILKQTNGDISASLNIIRNYSNK